MSTTTAETSVTEKPAAHRPAPKGATPLTTATSSVPPSEQTALIDLQLIDPNPYQHRQTMDDQLLEEMMASLVAQGLLQPVLMRPVGDRYQLVFGHRRKEAFARLYLRTQDPKWARIPAVIRVGMTDAEMQENNLTENLQSEDPPVVELAAGVAQYQRLNNLTSAQVADRLGLQEKKVKRLLTLNKAPTVIKTACSEGMVVVEDHEEAKGVREKRRLDMRACLQLFRLYKHYQTKDAFSADGLIGAVVEKALKHGWSVRQIDVFVAKEVGGDVGAAEETDAPTNSLPLFKASGKQLTFFRERIATATPAEKKEAKKLLEEFLREVA